MNLNSIFDDLVESFYSRSKVYFPAAFLLKQQFWNAITSSLHGHYWNYNGINKGKKKKRQKNSCVMFHIIISSSGHLPY